MVYKKVVFSFIIFLTLFTSCNTNEPDSKPANIEFAAEDASCTEAWLTLKVNDIAGAKVYRGDSLIFNLTQQNIDTTLYDEGLLPNHVYKYHTTIQPYNHSNVITKELTIQTMDTTSHNFTWQTYTFGEAGSSTFYDVAIINENNIWAVGEIYMNDSLGNPDPTFYNAVHWNGTNWELKKLFYKGGIWTIRTIFAFNENDIWFSAYMRYYNGQFIELPIPNILMGWQINKLWGSSSSNLYVVGNSGNIAHYDGSPLANGWQKIESGVSTDLFDIYGESENIFIAGWRDFQPSVLLRLKNGNLQKIIEDGDNLFNYRTDFISGAIYSVWITKKKLYVLTWYDLYRANFNTDGTAEAIWKGPIQNWGMISVRGNNVNDIIASGVPGKIWHYNGISWHTYNGLIDSRDRLRRIEIKDNICVAVGYRYENGIEDQALIHIGKR